MKKSHVILGIHITDRVKRAAQVQKLFTEYGCHIKTRLGLHEADDQCCSPAGLILLEIVGPKTIPGEMIKKLSKISGVDVQKMVFDHS